MDKNFATKIVEYEEIKDIPLWESQRDCDINRVNKIVEDQLIFYEKYKHFTFPGSLVIAIYQNSPYMIDGQHRRDAMKIIKSDHPDMPLTLTIEERYCYSKDHVNDIYIMINNVNTNNCMIKNGQIDPEGAKLKELHILLSNEYGKIWSDQSKKYPYIYKNTFDEKIKEMDAFKKLTAKQIFRQFKKRNREAIDYIKKNNPKAYTTAEKIGGFYLHYKQPNSIWLENVFTEPS